MINGKIKDILKKQHYILIGRHSAVQICNWTKKSLRNEGYCYKEKFYGICSHKCCQMSPYIVCQNKCLHCWRPIELDFGLKLKEKKIDDEKKIIEECIKAQRKLLSGFKGYKNTDLKKWKEAQNPEQFAISLIGEPTLYPKLAELIKELREQKKTIFLVTNGLNPSALLNLKKKNALPTQLYLSLNTPNEKLYKIWHKSRLKNAWKIFNHTLKIFPKLPTRKVIRMTLVRNLNIKDEFIPEYANLIRKANPDFIEVKSYMSIGFSKKRLGYERMPSHKEIKEFAFKLLNLLPGYKFLDEQVISRVVLLGKDKRKMKIKKKEI